MMSMSSPENSLSQPQSPNKDRQSSQPSSSNSDVTGVTPEKERTQPIPPPSHPRQYRAIGLIEGRYERSEEQLTQGNLITPNGDKIETVILGRVISLVKNHLDMDKEHLWVVYPRTKASDDGLHVQIVGVWEPETLNQKDESDTESDVVVKEGYFSIRGEVIFFDVAKESVVIKIKQFPRKEGEKPKFFKLKLKGVLGERPLRHFYDLNVQLEGEVLVVTDYTDLGVIKKKPRFNKKSKRPNIKGTKRSPSRKPNPISRPKPSIKKPGT